MEVLQFLQYGLKIYIHTYEYVVQPNSVFKNNSSPSVRKIAILQKCRYSNLNMKHVAQLINLLMEKKNQ